MRMLATGGHGVVGSYLPANVVRTDLDDCDVRDRRQVEKALDEHEPDAVIHLAALTDVDACELEPDEAFHTNALGTRNVALECGHRGIPLVYVSTAGVFSGEKHDPYHEFDVPGPANVYGHSKLEGERFVRQFAPKSFVVRAGWMIGGGPDGEQKFIAKMLRHAEQIGKIIAVSDKWGSPTYARHLVGGIMKLLGTTDFGVFHMVNEGACTRHEIAQAVNRLLGEPFEVTPVTSAAFPLPAPRARSEAMDNLMLRLHGWDWMPSWQDALAEYIEEEWASWQPQSMSESEEGLAAR
jgi:dTDP-4-dehydrorhamnose reductase